MTDASPIQSAAAPETVTLPRAEGTSFALSIFPAAEPAAPAILIEPAMGVKAGYYLKLAEALCAAGYNTAIAELRGHEARGGKRPGWRYDFGYHEMLHEDWPQAVAAVKARFPGVPLYLLGHSLGGQISCLYAAAYPGSIAGLILIACSSVHWRLWPRAFLPYSQIIGATGRLLGHFPGQRFRFAAREARTVMADWARQARTGHFRFGRPRVDYEDKLAAVTLPAIGISFTTDFFATRRAMDGLLGKLPQLQLERHHLDPKALGFEKIDHFRWARQPAIVLPLVKAWLEARRR